MRRKPAIGFLGEGKTVTISILSLQSLTSTFTRFSDNSQYLDVWEMRVPKHQTSSGELLPFASNRNDDAADPNDTNYSRHSLPRSVFEIYYRSGSMSKIFTRPSFPAVSLGNFRFNSIWCPILAFLPMPFLNFAAVRLTSARKVSRF